MATEIVTRMHTTIKHKKQETFLNDVIFPKAITFLSELSAEHNKMILMLLLRTWANANANNNNVPLSLILFKGGL